MNDYHVETLNYSDTVVCCQTGFAISKINKYDGQNNNERFRDANSGYSGYKSAHAYKCTRVVQSRTFRVIKQNGDVLWLLMETNGIGKRDSVLSKIIKS